MIVYQATKAGFADDVLEDKIDAKIYEIFRKKLNRSTSANEVSSWKDSMQYMDRVLNDSSIPDDCGVAIEYQLPQSSKRIDFIITGTGEQNKEYAILIELKRWSEATLSPKDGVVNTLVGRRIGEHTHPSYQAWSYASLLENFNATVADEAINLQPCAYLHNYVADDVIANDHYKEYIEKAPLFLKGDAVKLRNFIKQFVKYGDKNNLLYRIDNGKIRPSKMLADSLSLMLKGNKEFILIEDQKLAYEEGLALTAKASAKSKQVLIVKGGPGTGKSVVAINLLVEITKRGMLTQYVSKNAAPRAVYEKHLTNTLKKSVISHLFTGSGAFIDSNKQNTFDALIVDESHRLNAKSGIYKNLGENQVKELINAAQCTIFFIDEDQQVTLDDIGSVGEIRKWADYYGAHVKEMELASQFRCSGSDGYLAWIDNTLQIRETANTTLEEDFNYDFRVFDDPNELRATIEEKNKVNGKSRMLAGYCWRWVSKKDSTLYDVTIPEYDFKMRWNLTDDGSAWASVPSSINEIGCIHTIQGLDLEYAGVIIGNDLVVVDDTIISQPKERDTFDSTIRGYKKLLQEQPEEGATRIDSVIKNTYRALMTRGMRGTYVYACDPALSAYLKQQIPAYSAENRTFKLLTAEEALGNRRAVAFVDIMAAAGSFSDNQLSEQQQWIELPNDIKDIDNHFVCKVVGESMNKVIKNGSYCLFRRDTGGSREGKIVLVQSTDIQDADFGSGYTVKEYHSSKQTTEEGWRHESITLKPLSDDPSYRNIKLSEDALLSLKVVGIFKKVLNF